MQKKIFLDLDGVVRDWTRGIIKWYSLDCFAQDVTTWNFFEGYVKEQLNMSPKEFWEGQTATFWETLPFTQDAPKILDIMGHIQRTGTTSVFILTSPTLTNAGSTQTWIRKNMPVYFNEKRYIIGPPKYACASPDSLLIDDAEKNAFAFWDAGGDVFLYPQPWNFERASTKNAVDEMVEFLMLKEVL